MKQPVD